jgi:carbonic anhydrase/acetyltransferase-like protein (isoleucine patch superfamily)
MIKGFAGKTPRIAASALIAEGAHIIGDVEIGENSSVWPGAVIRGDFGRIVIGGNTAVEDNAVIHSGTPTGPIKDVTIGGEVHIGHGAVINCHRIGNNTLIGMNATVLHDVEIGSGCIIGAGCLVPQGMKIPDGSFVVGVPGKIKGPVSAQQSFWIKEAPQTYIRLVAQYREGGGL